MTYALSGNVALLLVDVQQDFLPGGRLAVPDGDQVIAPLNRYLAWFAARDSAVFASRDWHPANHCSFTEQGGPWPAHCIQGSDGAALSPRLQWPAKLIVIDKAQAVHQDAYSAFDGTALGSLLRQRQVKSLAIGGLATEYCVRHSVLDALQAGFEVFLLLDGIRAIDAKPHDGDRAISDMLHAGARAVLFDELVATDPLADPDV